MTNKELLIQEYIKNYKQLTALARSFHKNMELGEDSLQALYINLLTVKSEVYIEKPREFVKTALFNVCANSNRQIKTQLRKIDKLYNHSMITARWFATDPEKDSIQQEYMLNRQALITHFANGLKRVQRNIFLQLLNGKSMKEIAAETGSAYDSVKHNRRLIVQKLQQFFKEHNEEFSYERIKVSGAV